MQSKREMAIDKLTEWQGRLICPICQEELEWNGKQVACSANHSFDLAKQGYVNLAPQHQELHYDKSLFEARHVIMNDVELYRGIYQKMLEGLSALGVDVSKRHYIADFGTGEGTHLDKFVDIWPSNDIHAMGIDIAKASIVEAAKHYTDELWLVADLSRVPLAEGSLDGALTILAPSNYEESKRAIKKGGWFIKIVPDTYYLKELREQVLEADKVLHDNTQTLDRFDQAFPRHVHIDFEHEVELTTDDMALLVKMTPLMWNVEESERAKIIEKMQSITVDLDILIGIVEEN